MGFEIINILKKEKGLTNAQIAKLSGVTLSTLDKITSGVNTNPKLDTLQAICSVLGCTLNDFMESPPKNKKAPSLSDEAQKLVRDYEVLDSYGKQVVRMVASEEKIRCEEQAKASAPMTIYVAADTGSGDQTAHDPDITIPEKDDQIP